MGDDIAQQDDTHEVACIADGSFAGAEEVEDGVEENQGDESEGKADDEIQQHDIAQDVLGRVVILLSQTDRY